MSNFKDPEKNTDSGAQEPKDKGKETSLSPAIKTLTLLDQTEAPGSFIRDSMAILTSKIATPDALSKERGELKIAVLTVEHLQTALKARAVMPVDIKYPDHYTAEEIGQTDLLELICIPADNDSSLEVSREQAIRMAQIRASNEAQQDGIIAALRLPIDSYTIQVAVEKIVSDIHPVLGPFQRDIRTITAPIVDQINIMASALDLPEDDDPEDGDPYRYLIKEHGITQEWLNGAIQANISRAGILLVFKPEEVEEYKMGAEQIPGSETRIVPHGIPLDKIIMAIPLGEVEQSALKLLSDRANS